MRPSIVRSVAVGRVSTSSADNVSNRTHTKSTIIKIITTGPFALNAYAPARYPRDVQMS